MNRCNLLFAGIVCLSLTSAGLLGCDTKKKLDGMVDTTEKMEKTTKEMSESTGNIENLSEHLSERTEKLYTGMREGESIQIQMQAFDSLVHDPGITSKANAALIYFAAMEFQHWYPTQTESQTQRETLYLKAVELLFSKIEDYVKDDMPVTDIFSSNDWVILSVLSVGMSKIHPDQLVRASEMNFQPVSFYDLIKEGLNSKSKYLSGEKIKAYQLKVLENERTALYLLHLRQNFFKALVLGRLSKFEENLLDKIGMGLIGWRAELDTFPNAEIKLLNEWLWKSLETQNYLLSLGEPLEHNYLFHHIFNMGQLWVNSEESAQDVALFDGAGLMPLARIHQLPAVDTFLALLPRVLKEPGSCVVRNMNNNSLQQHPRRRPNMTCEHRSSH